MGTFEFDEVAQVIAKQENLTLHAARVRAAYRDFARAVEQSGWTLLSNGDKLEKHIMHSALVVGVALWSPHDVEALNKLSETQVGYQKVYVFNVDEVGSGGTSAFLPDAPVPVQTPVLAIYLNEKLVEFLEGFAAFNELTDGFKDRVRDS